MDYRILISAKISVICGQYSPLDYVYQKRIQKGLAELKELM